MAKTQIADVVVPRIQMPYIIRRTMELSRFFASGLIRTDAELNSIASGAGKTFDLPFWSDLSGASEALSDSGSLTPAKIGADKDTAVKHFRGKAFSTNDLAGVLAGSDPMAAIGDLVAAYWARDMQKSILLPSLQGIFATTLAGNVLDVSRATAGAVANANCISSAAMIDATTGTLGDAWEQIVAICVHSKVFADMQKLGLITFVSLKDQDTQVPFFLGREVMVDDGMPVTSPGGGIPDKYTSYLFARGSIGYGDGGPNDDTGLETDRDKLAGDDFLITRRHFILHPRGVAFTGTVAGVTPSDAEMKLGANWGLKWERKAIGIVKLVTNAGYVAP